MANRWVASRMKDASVRPIPGHPILNVTPFEATRGGVLVVADAHLGLGSFRPGQPSPPGARAEDMADELLSVARSTQAEAFVFAGDIKQPIVGMSPPLRRELFDFFSTLLSTGLSVDVVPGNHDVGLARGLPREVRLHPVAGARLLNVGIFHGHAWPSNAVLRSPVLVAGHLHPGYRLAPSADSIGGKKRCWLRVELPPPRRDHRRRRHGPVLARELIVLPALNPLTGTESLNRAAPARYRSFLWKRFVLRGTARAYLLDGTDLGLLRPPAPEPTGSRLGSAAAPDP
ncbi:MAG: metallophosphoesterase [Thermoplasmata archaeon]|nr:metallophosphoesterase [Thermoplasmata archaeon]